MNHFDHVEMLDDIATGRAAQEPAPGSPEVLRYCAGAACPGLSYRASEIPHPASCVKPEAVAQAAETVRHTPGPWYVLSRPGGTTIRAGGRALAALLGTPNEERAANAALIARAWEIPELERQRAELADALEAYLEDWERDAQITFNEGDDQFYAAVRRQGPHDAHPATLYVSRNRWERREKAREALRKAGR